MAGEMKPATLLSGVRIQLPLNRLVVSTWNLRRHNVRGRFWDEFSDSIDDVGVTKELDIATEPVMTDDGWKYEIMDGQRRYIHLLNTMSPWEKVWCMPIEFKGITSKIIYGIHLHKNREDLHFSDYRRAIEHLRNECDTIEEVAEIIKKPVTWIKGILSTMSQAEEIQRKIDESEIEPEKQTALVGLFKDSEKEITDEAVIKAKELTQKELREAKKLRREGVAPDEALSRAKSELEKRMTKPPKPENSYPGYRVQGSGSTEEEEDITPVHNPIPDFEEHVFSMGVGSWADMNDTYLPTTTLAMIHEFSKNHEISYSEALNILVKRGTQMQLI